MVLTLKISDTDLDRLKDALKITREDYDRATKPDEMPEYAKRILYARGVLDLSRAKADCTYTPE